MPINQFSKKGRYFFKFYRFNLSTKNDLSAVRKTERLNPLDLVGTERQVVVKFLDFCKSMPAIFRFLTS